MKGAHERLHGKQEENNHSSVYMLCGAYVVGAWMLSGYALSAGCVVVEDCVVVFVVAFFGGFVFFYVSYDDFVCFFSFTDFRNSISVLVMPD